MAMVTAKSILLVLFGLFCVMSGIGMIAEDIRFNQPSFFIIWGLVLVCLGVYIAIVGARRLGSK